MIRQVGIIKAQIKNLQESVDVLVESRGDESAPKRARLSSNQTDQVSRLIPINSMDDLDPFVNAMKDDTLRNAVVRLDKWNLNMNLF